MATTEEFLVSIGIDKASVDSFVARVEEAKAKAAADPVTIQLAVAMDASVEAIIGDLARMREEEEAAAESAARMKVEQDAVSQSLSEMQAEMDATAQATVKMAQDADSALQTLQGGMIAVGVAAAGISAALKHASDEASGDEQAYAQLGIAFGSLRDKAAEASEAISAATGRAVSEVQTLLSRANLAVQAFGYTGDAAMNVSKQLVQAAINMSAVVGTDASTILQQFSTGLHLSGRALLQYGINLDAARVKAEALKMGLDPKHLDTYAEAQVKMSLILKDTAKFTGAASSEQQTMTERMRDLSAIIGETFGELGQYVNEIMGPFIKQITETVREIKDWMAANPKLTKTITAVGIAAVSVVTAVGAIAGAVALATLAYGQYTAISTVFVGAQAAIAASEGVSTAAITANTAALAANTSAQAENARASQLAGVQATTVGKVATILNKALKMTTAELWLNIKGWATLVATKVGDWIYSAWQGLTKMAGGMATLTGHLLKGNIGIRSWVNMMGGELSPTLMQTVGSTSALTTGVLGLAAAFAGFKIGGMIEEWLGLADAQERVMKGTATEADKWKSTLTTALMAVTPVLGWAALAWKKYYEYQNQAIKNANAAEIKKTLDTFNATQLVKYNQYLKEGMADWRALKAAIGDTAGELTRFTWLLGKKDLHKASKEELLELETLYLKLSQTVPGFADQYAKAMGLVSSSTKEVQLSLAAANKILKDTQKSYEEAKKSLEGAELKLNLGADAAKSYEELQKLSATMEMFRQRALAHKRVIEDLYNTRTGTTVSSEAVQGQVDAQMKALAEIRRLAEIAAREQTRLLEESFAKQAQTWKTGYDAEIKAAEDRKNRIVEIERKKVEEIQQLIDKEMGIRKAANEKLAAFERSLDEAAVRRHDATQAEMNSLVESAQAAMKDASDQETRARVLAKVTEELKRLASQEEESKRIAEQLAAARKDLLAAEKALAAAAGTDQEAGAKERLAEAQKKVNDLAAAQSKEDALRQERAALADAQAKALAETSAQQAKDAAIRDQEILALQQEKLLRQQEINTAEVAFQQEVVKSKAEYEKKLEVLDRFRTKMEEIVKLQAELTRLQAMPSQYTDKAAIGKTSAELAAKQYGLREMAANQNAGLEKAPDDFSAATKAAIDSFTQQVEGAVAKVQESAANVETAKAEVETAQANVEQSAVQVATAETGMGASMENLAAAVAAMIPSTDALVAKTAQVEAAVQPIPDAMNSALDAQNTLAASVEGLGNTTVAFAKSMQKKWSDVGIRLDALDAELKRLTNGGGGEAAAAGY